MDNIEEVFIKYIINRKPYHKSFKEITESFEEKFLEFNPIQNLFELEKYFGIGNRIKNASKLLRDDNFIHPFWLKEYTTKNGTTKIDFKGLYIFIHNTTPFYIGISKGVIGRLCQHLKGNSHYTATIAYRLGLIKYDHDNGSLYPGERKELDWISNVEPAKEFLMKQKAAFIAIEDDIELYLFEVFCAMKLGTCFNEYKTH